MKARWHGEPKRDYKNQKWIMEFETEEIPLSFDKTKDKDLTLEIKIFRQKRSLNANKYFHKLVELIAEATNSSHTEIHNRLIAEYGQRDMDLNNVILEDSIPYEKIATIHLRPTTRTQILDNGKLYRVYFVMRGSHTYDTKEMARLIDGTVSEAKELGIETLPPDEIEKMKALWSIT